MSFNICECSEFFQNFVPMGLSFLDVLNVKQPKLKLNDNYFLKLDGKLIIFFVNNSEIKFRGTIHEIDDSFVMLAWPAFNDISQIQENKISKYMIHPACSITDTLIIKDVLNSANEKFKKLELKKIQAEKEKELSRKSDIAKSQFLAHMSHEIRTPLNGMLGSIELLQDSGLNQDQLELVKVLKLSGENLLSILNDILDFSKIDANKLVFEEVQFDFVSKVIGIIKLLKYEADSKEVSLNLNYDDTFPRIYIGDPVRIAQALSNIISNAIKFTNEGAVNVSLSLLENEKVQIQVKDTGIGISEEDQKSLFEPFSQADASITRKFGGTGLGLVIAKKIVNFMEGDIYLDSVPDVGSTFTIILNLKNVDENSRDDILVEDQLPCKDNELGARFPMKILVAEDNTVNTFLIKKLLKKLGYENCHFVSDGEKALTELRDTEVNGIPTYSLILMDMQMPNLDGIEATKIIKKSYGKNSPIILAITANAFKEDLDKCISAGMDACITKPISIGALKSLLYVTGKKINK